MSGDKEIVGKIKSVQNTRKVTRALEMVSASKIRKAQDMMQASRPYARMMRQVIGHLAHANLSDPHPFMVERQEIKRVGYVVVATDRGLCGGLNSNMFRQLLGEFRHWQEKGVEVTTVIIGRKAAQFFRRLKVDIAASTQDLGESPQLEELIGVIKVMLDDFRAGNLDRIDLCYNRFINTMSQKV
ncbi:MAG: FoF1 ATP synthase subunit gamma, partial [Wenzhouxiangella sp.]|nr:FoF1 ATP synthase subunit gamma [Wenzhouxiangella sp.]